MCIQCLKDWFPCCFAPPAPVRVDPRNGVQEREFAVQQVVLPMIVVVGQTHKPAAPISRQIPSGRAASLPLAPVVPDA